MELSKKSRSTFLIVLAGVVILGALGAASNILFRVVILGEVRLWDTVFGLIAGLLFIYFPIRILMKEKKEKEINTAAVEVYECVISHLGSIQKEKDIERIALTWNRLKDPRDLIFLRSNPRLSLSFFILSIVYVFLVVLGLASIQTVLSEHSNYSGHQIALFAADVLIRGGLIDLFESFSIAELSPISSDSKYDVTDFIGRMAVSLVIVASAIAIFTDRMKRRVFDRQSKTLPGKIKLYCAVDQFVRGWIATQPESDERNQAIQKAYESVILPALWRTSSVGSDINEKDISFFLSIGSRSNFGVNPVEKTLARDLDSENSVAATEERAKFHKDSILNLSRTDIVTLKDRNDSAVQLYFESDIGDVKYLTADLEQRDIYFHYDDGSKKPFGTYVKDNHLTRLQSVGWVDVFVFPNTTRRGKYVRLIVKRV